MRNALNSRLVAGALRNRNSLQNPNVRNGIAARAAMAGRFHGHGDHGGWWHHHNGGYGWVGPLFWPFAYYDFYAYALWGYGYDDSFWDYGYDDIYVGLFGPYGYDDLAGYLPEYSDGSPRSASRTARRRGEPETTGSVPSTTTGLTIPSQLAQMCGEDTRDVAGLSIDRIQQAIQPDVLQRAVLDDLASASEKAAQIIKAACPTDIALTASGRMKAMEGRIEAMIQAVNVVQPQLERFYGLLNDEQKARLTALGNEQREDRTADAEKAGGSFAQNCGAAQAGVTNWPTADIERVLRPTEAQRASLAELQNATAKAADILKACPSEDPLTPPARLKAVGDRLQTMLKAVKTVHTALDKFYGELNDEQKALFEKLGRQRTSQVDQADSSEDQPSARHHHVRRHGVISLRTIMRRLGI